MLVWDDMACKTYRPIVFCPVPVVFPIPLVTCVRCEQTVESAAAAVYLVETFKMKESLAQGKKNHQRH